MHASVIIPTNGRARQLARCLERLAGQDLEPDRYEVLVAIDGPCPVSRNAAEQAWSEAKGRAQLRVLPLGHAGLAAARNAALDEARGDVMISINDDVLPCEGFVRAHLDTQEIARGRGLGMDSGGEGGCIVSGHSPWVVHAPDRLFDRMVRETPMVFFYAEMEDEAREHTGADGSGRMDDWRDWGFRHAWGLNMSAPMWAARRIGASPDRARTGEVFKELPGRYGYEDLELAWRCSTEFGMPVVFRTEARAPHDHRMEPRGYLEREALLGRSAPGFAQACPECAHDVFERDVASDEEHAYSLEFLEREHANAERLQSLFEASSEMSAAMADGPAGRALVDLAYGEHLLVKRFWWRKGLVEARSLVGV